MLGTLTIETLKVYNKNMKLLNEIFEKYYHYKPNKIQKMYFDRQDSSSSLLY